MSRDVRSESHRLLSLYDLERMEQIARRVLAKETGLSDESRDDLVQESLLAYVRKAPEISRPHHWIRAVARKLFLLHLRKRYRSHRSGTEQLDGNRATDRGLRTDELVALREALADLPGELRRALLQHELDGLSALEIADAEGVPVSVVYSRKRRAIVRLRKSLSPPPARRSLPGKKVHVSSEERTWRSCGVQPR